MSKELINIVLYISYPQTNMTSYSGDFFERRMQMAKHMKEVLTTKKNDTAMCQLKGSIQKIQRIGSKSVYGQVFKISEKEHPNHIAAAKVMYDTKENIQELKWYHIFEKFVAQGKCLHFPLVYFHKTCRSCAFDNNVKDLPKKKNENQQCIVAISELAAGDLKSFIGHVSSSKRLSRTNTYDFISFIAQTMIAVYALSLQNVIHDDLHWGNVLFLPSPDLKGKWMSYTVGDYQIDIRNTGYFWILWDFGKMKKATGNSQLISRDLYRILHFARWAKNEKMRIPKDIETLCDIALECIENTTSWRSFIELIIGNMPPKLMSLVTYIIRMKVREDPEGAKKVTLAGPYISSVGPDP